MGASKEKHILKLDIQKDTTQSDLIYEALIREASVLPGDFRDIDKFLTESEIPWLNPDLIKEGQDFVRRNWFGVYLAHFIALVIGASLKPGTAVLLRTGLSHLKEHSVVRYLSTSLHVRVWYEDDFKGVVKDVQKVRRLHSKALTTFYTTPLPKIEDMPLSEENTQILSAVRADMKAVPVLNQIPDNLLNYEPEVPMSQLAMVMTQFSFMGFVVLFPQIFGIHDLRGIDGFCHIWAVLGKMLGIEDRFNLGLHKNEHVMKRLFNEISIPGLKTADELTMTFWDSVITGVAKYRGPMTLNSTLRFMIQDLVGVQDAKSLYKIASWYDRYCYQVLHIVCAYLLQVNIIRWIVNVHAQYAISVARRKYM